MNDTKRDVNLWKIPLLVSLAAILLFGITMIPDTLDSMGAIHLPSWLSMGSIDDARAILSAMMGAVATVLALIFSVALLVLSMVATLFGPRLLYRFLQDWVTQATIGVFMGTFIYVCLCFLVTHQDGSSRFVPQISLLTSWFLVVGSFAFLVFYSHRIAVSIQNPDMIARVVDDLSPAVVAAQRRGNEESTRGALEVSTALRLAKDSGSIVLAGTSGYVQHLDHAALVRAATGAAARIVFAVRPGQFVLHGEPLASVVPPAAAERLGSAIALHVAIGRHRTIAQDVEFGIAQIVEIGIRALSPAVNDTFTGVACVDRIAEALLVLEEAGPRDGGCFDAEGALRVFCPPVRIERLVKLGFDQIRQASTTTPAVLIRQLEAVRRLAPRMGAPSRAALFEQADAIRESAPVLVALDRRDLEAAYARARAALDAGLGPAGTAPASTGLTSSRD